MTRKILNRYGKVLWSGDAETVRDALHEAYAARVVLTGADLTGAVLRGAVLTGAVLRGADLTGADLTGAVLRGAVLRGAVLTGAVLRGADLTGADLTGAFLRGAVLTGAVLRGAVLRGAVLTGAVLRGADLTGAVLTGADLTGAFLRGAVLTGAFLRGAVLRGAVLTPIRDDLWAVLSSAPAEVPALLAALKEGRVDGSTYSGACACLVGTLANARGCDYANIAGLSPNASRPAEMFFLAIRPGQTPENHEPSRLAAEWVEQWLTNVRTLVEETRRERAMSEGPMNLWQVICYGADDAAMAALCYFRARGWAVDAQVYPEREECEDRIYSFICGYETAVGVPR